MAPREVYPVIPVQPAAPVLSAEVARRVEREMQDDTGIALPQVAAPEEVDPAVRSHVRTTSMRAWAGRRVGGS